MYRQVYVGLMEAACGVDWRMGRGLSVVSVLVFHCVYEEKWIKRGTILFFWVLLPFRGVTSIYLIAIVVNNKMLYKIILDAWW